MPDEPHEQGRIVIVDPRRTVTVNACEAEAGKDRVLHLAINSGTDLALFNALLTYIADKGWIDKDFIAASTNDFDKALAANRTSVEDAAEITGLAPADIVKAAEWIAQPKEGGARRRTMFSYEKGLIWGNDNYRTNAALVNVALATGNIGRPGGGCVRMGGHQEGYARPSDAHVGRPAAYVDQLLIERQGRRPSHLGLRPLQDDAQRARVQAPLQGAHRHGEGRHVERSLWRSAGDGRGHHGGDPGRAACSPSMSTSSRPRSAQACHVWLPAATSGEMNLTSMNGERRMRLDRALHGPARPVDAGLPDRRAHRQPYGAGVPRDGQGRRTPTSSRASTGRPKKTPSWTAITPMPAAASSSPTSGCGRWAPTASRSRPPASRTARSSAPSASTPTASSAGKDGKATFFEAQWRGLQARGKQAEKDKFAFLINNGRTNHVWQSAYLDQENELVMDRWPYPFIEMNPADMDGARR